MLRSIRPTRAAPNYILKAAELTGLRPQVDGDGGEADERREQPRPPVQAAQLLDQGRPQLRSRRIIGPMRVLRGMRR